MFRLARLLTALLAFTLLAANSASAVTAVSAEKLASGSFGALEQRVGIDALASSDRVDEKLVLLYDFASDFPVAPKAAAPTGSTYSVAYETRLNSSSYPGASRGRHFQEANENLLQAMEADASFATMMRQGGVNLGRTPTGLAPSTSPAGWTWHHAEGAGVMQLVPRSQHAPGSIFQDALHPGGRGGYSIWGQ